MTGVELRVAYLHTVEATTALKSQGQHIDRISAALLNVFRCVLLFIVSMFIVFM